MADPLLLRAHTGALVTPVDAVSAALPHVTVADSDKPAVLGAIGAASAVNIRNIILSPEDPSINAVGDGVTDDTAAFNKLNAIVAASGSAIIVLRKSYYLPNGWTVPSNVDVYGHGIGTIVHAGTGSYSGGIVLTTNGSNINLYGVTVTAPTGIARANAKFAIVGQGVTNFRIQDCITNYGLCGVWLNTCKHGIVSHCKVMNPVADGIHFAVGCQYVVAENNYVENTGDDALACTVDRDTASNASLRSKGIIFRGNRVNKAVSGCGVAIYDTQDFIVENNTIDNVDGPFVQVAHYADSVLSSRGTIKNNRGLSCGNQSTTDASRHACLSIGSCTNILIEDNDFGTVGGTNPIAIFLSNFSDVIFEGGRFADIPAGASTCVYMYSGTGTNSLVMDGVIFERVVPPINFGGVVGSGNPAQSLGPTDIINCKFISSGTANTPYLQINNAGSRRVVAANNTNDDKTQGVTVDPSCTNCSADTGVPMTYTPTVTNGNTGAVITGATATGSYTVKDQVATISWKVSITTSGTGNAGGILVLSAPSGLVAGPNGGAGNGRESVKLGVGVSAIISGSGTAFALYGTGNQSMLNDGYVLSGNLIFPLA